MPLFGKLDLRFFGGIFDRTCVRPHDVASMTPRAGMLFGRLGSHRFRELPALEPRSECPCLELQSPYRLLLVDRSPRPCGHAVPSPMTGFGSRHPVILLLRRHGPDRPRHLVRQRDGRDHLQIAGFNTCRSSILNVWAKQVSSPLSEASVTATTTLSRKPSMASTRLRSFIDADHGAASRRLSSQPWSGSTGQPPAPSGANWKLTCPRF